MQINESRGRCRRSIAGGIMESEWDIFTASYLIFPLVFWAAFSLDFDLNVSER